MGKPTRNWNRFVLPVIGWEGPSRDAARSARRWVPALLLGLLTVWPAFASERQIYGRVTYREKPVPEGTRVVITSSTGSYITTTNRYGSYQITFPTPKKNNSKSKEQSLLVLWNDKTLSLQGFSPTGSAARYNLVIAKTSKGYSLRKENSDEGQRIIANLRKM